jgi:DNA-binding transcriptional LysR family regulator
MYDRAALERALSESDRPARIGGLVAPFSRIAALLQDTDLAAIVPRPLAKSLAEKHLIATYELPYSSSRLEVRQLWRQRTADDPSHE